MSKFQNRPQRGYKRLSVIKRAVEGCLGSKFFLFVLILTIVLVYFVLFNHSKLLFVFPIAFAAFYWKSLLFESLVIKNAIAESWGFFKWYHKVDNNLYLGAIPICEMDHFETIIQHNEISAILSVIEDFELNCSTLVGTPLYSPSCGVDHCMLRVPDFVPPSFSILDQGAEYINRYTSQGKSVYVHCKAGVGRSASVVIAYMMKYKRMSLLDAHAAVRSIRPVIFPKPSRNYTNMEAYDKKNKGL